MATTTNYSWTTPDDTDLVKDGAAAIRTLGTAIDSTVFTNAGAAINKSIVDAAGDLIYATADNTVARLAIGTANQVLKVNSGATAPEWGTAPSGGMTLLSTTTLSGASTTISSISQDYTKLFVLVVGMTNNTGNGEFRVAINGGTTNSVTGGVFVDNNSAYAYRLFNDYGTRYSGNLGGVNRTSANNGYTLEISNYTSTTTYKPIQYVFFCNDANTTNYSQFGGGGLFSNSAVTSLVFSNGGGTWSAGTVYVYGVK